MTHLPIWFLDSIPEQVCDALREDFSVFPKRDAAMGEQGEVKQHSHRDTTVCFVDKGHSFEDTMLRVANAANVECNWGYELQSNEAIQYAEYGVNQHYNWHVDNFPLTPNSTDRKITVICLLNDPEEFTGGNFEMRLYQEYIAPLKKGTIIAFPSVLEHRVTPVLSGKRISATMWVSGPRFR